MSSKQQNQNGDCKNANAYQAAFDELQSTFESDITKDLAWRKRTLRQILAMFQGEENCAKWTAALVSDLGGGEVRALMEIAAITEEIHTCLSNLDTWAADRPASLGDPTAEIPFLDKRVIRPTPKGTMLIIGTWNFPSAVLFMPLVDAIAAGNTCIIKPSELTPRVTELVVEMVKMYLPEDKDKNNAVKVVCGGIPETTEVLKLPFDHITFTGGTKIGKIVLAAAAKNLTPCTLELGGKSPTFVDSTANLKLAADRIVLAKSTNAGQWCVNADYLLVDETIVDAFVEYIVAAAKTMVGSEMQQKDESGSIDVSQRWCNRIVSEGHTKRLMSYLEEDHGGEVILGGLDSVDVKAKFFPLTVVLNPKMDTKLMLEEIFGPILVIKTVPNVDEAISIAKRVCSSPLSLYVFSNDKQYTQKILTKCTSGSVGVNTCGEQISANTVPLGGVGQSGMGAYHGKSGFDEYSHMRSIFYRTNVLPLMMLPSFMMSKENQFPTWVKPLLFKKINGFVPAWAKQAFYVAVLAVLLMIALKKFL